MLKLLILTITVCKEKRQRWSKRRKSAIIWLECISFLFLFFSEHKPHSPVGRSHWTEKKEILTNTGFSHHILILLPKMFVLFDFTTGNYVNTEKFTNFVRTCFEKRERRTFMCFNRRLPGKFSPKKCVELIFNSRIFGYAKILVIVFFLSLTFSCAHHLMFLQIAWPGNFCWANNAAILSEFTR